MQTLLRVHRLGQIGLYQIQGGVDSVSDLGAYLSRLLDVPADRIEGLTGAIASQLPQPNGDCRDLYLPMMGRAEWRDRANLLASARVQIQPDDSLLLAIPSEPRIEAFATAAMLSASRSPGAAALRLQNTVEENTVFLSLSPLLAYFGIRLDGIEPWEPVNAVIQLTMPAESFGAWFNIPEPKTVLRFQTYRSVSRAIQYAMRAWLPFFAFTRLEHYMDETHGRALAVYRSSWAHVPPSRFEFSRDVWNSEAVSKLCGSAIPNLGKEFARVENALQQAGYPEQAARFSPRGLTLLNSNPSECEVLLSVMRAEALAFDHLSNFGEACTTTARKHQAPIKAAWTPSQELRVNLQRSFRRVFAGKTYPRLAPIIAWTATCGLLTGLGRPTGLSIAIKITDSSGRVHHVQKSNANFSSSAPLTHQELAA